MTPASTDSGTDADAAADGAEAPSMPSSRRLHPISVPYRVVQSALGVLPLLIFVAFFSGSALGAFGILFWSVALVGVVAALGVWHAAYYRRFAYETTPDTFDIRSGVVSRRRREIPYERVQNVDISRNVVQRMLGIAELRIETAGGSQTEATLRYVGYEEAKRLQDELRRRKRRERADESATTSAGAIETLLYAITPGDLAVLAIASFDLRLASFLSVLLSITAPPVLIEILTDLPISPLVVVAAGIVVLVVGSAIVSGTNAVVNTYGFRLSRAGDELRYERGLFQRFDGSIPLDKVQTLAVRENLLKRAFDYASLVVETAGYAPGQGGNVGSESAIPIARRDRTWAIAREIEPFPEFDLTRPPRRARRRYAMRYLIAVGALLAAVYAATLAFPVEVYWPVFAIGVALAPIAAHLKWKSRGYHAGDRYVVTRDGFWHRTTRIVPYYRVQTVMEHQTVFQRRWRLSTVTIDTAGSSGLIGGNSQALDLDQGDAAQLREVVASRLQEALIARSRERRRDARPGATGFGPRSDLADRREAFVDRGASGERPEERSGPD